MRNKEFENRSELMLQRAPELALIVMKKSELPRDGMEAQTRNFRRDEAGRRGGVLSTR